jgi:uncharacterized protein (TIGR01777 family)
MKIAIAGSTGFIGKQLSDYLLRSGNELIVISRGDFAGGSDRLSKVINSADVIINLVGASVLRRWTKKNRQIILSSRADTTRLLVEAVLNNPVTQRPNVFLNASAIGIYENSGIHDEFSMRFGTDFLATVCQAWEGETIALKEANIRLCSMRIGIVLGNTGGSLAKMLPIFKLGLGGKMGSGDQPFSFIHITDFCRAIEHLITNEKSSGIYNFVSPHSITNGLFVNTLSNVLHRPAFFAIPEFALKLLYGEASELLTKGVSVKPTRLSKEGFQFRFTDISSALTDLLQKNDAK